MDDDEGTPSQVEQVAGAGAGDPAAEPARQEWPIGWPGPPRPPDSKVGWPDT